MFIKSLEILGFKSFAEKTDVEFSSGITSVVGPNGCGKSNIADALMWVLGESNVRNIRAQRAVDVIFSGTDKKRALGMAEVSLTLDNSCGTLPVSFNEVTVTRRAYRSGESEYLINKTRCRLKDIYELFLDTGIGREAYSFVTQGELDAVLSAKSEDRRELIEEAAGIKKYRYRREEANRKLDKTQANLLRICDIMSELDGQLEPLAHQADQARKFEELQARLNEIEIGLLIRDLLKYMQSLEEVRNSKREAVAELEKYEQALAELEAQHEKQTEKLNKLEQQVEEARRVQMSLLGNVQRLDSRAALLDERLNSARSQIKQTDEEIANLSGRIDETRSRIGKLEIEEQECAAVADRAKSSVDSKSDILAELDRLFDEASRAVNDQKASYLELAKEIAAKRNALQNSRQRLVDLQTAVDKRQAEIVRLEAQLDESQKSGETAASEAQTTQSRIKELADKLAGVMQTREAAEAEIVETNRRIADLARTIASKSSRLGTLKEMAESHEGFYEGVKSVMAAAKTDKLPGNFAVVADVIDVPKGYEVAIETALGASLQDIIADTVEQAKGAISYLKTQQAGRATFLPLDGMRSQRQEVRGNMDLRSGAVGIASELIGYDRRYDPAVKSLLSRTVIAQTIDQAVGLSRNLSGWNKIVTLEGELIVPSGAITGGARRSKGPGLLVRKQEIDSLGKELASLGDQSKELFNQSQAIEQQIAAHNQSITQIETLTAESRAAHNEQTRRADFATRESERLAKQLDTARIEKEEAELLVGEESQTADQLRQLLETVGQANEDLDEKVAGAEQDIETLRQRRSAAREELMGLNADLAASTQRLSSLRYNLTEMRSSVEQMTVELQTRQSTSGGAATNIDSIVAERGTVEQERNRQRELLEAAEANLRTLSTEKSTESTSAMYVEARLKEATQQRNQLSEQSHEADVREARLEVQATLAAERLTDEYGISREQAMDWPEVVEVERGTATEVARLRREIKDMGLVNTGAVAEYERIKERWDFLTAQRSDLEEARDQINAAIREIDTNTRGLFTETYNAVAANFDVMFKRLFGGGKTELSLTLPNDLLATGIDVSVQPPGKKLQDMSLLSGGEKALTACAFIFALLMAKPSPFVVMDEVDAPLDESNVERFVEVLKDFSKDSQFIVVTHNRATMESADTLYGVTMQEAGISKLISVKLSSESTDKQERSLLYTS